MFFVHCSGIERLQRSKLLCQVCRKGCNCVAGTFLHCCYQDSHEIYTLQMASSSFSLLKLFKRDLCFLMINGAISSSRWWTKSHAGCRAGNIGAFVVAAWACVSLLGFWTVGIWVSWNRGTSKSPILDWDFPVNKPSILGHHLGVPPFMETPICLLQNIGLERI